MIRPFGRAMSAAVLAGLLGAAWAALFYAWHATLRLEFDRDLPRTVSGVYTPERDQATGLTFAWTGADAAIRLPGLDRAKPWTLTLRVRGARAVDNPSLTLLADGIVVGTTTTATEWTSVTVEIPPRPERRGLVLNITSSATFVPGPGDPRALGVMLDSLSLSPAGIVLVPRPVLTAASLSSAAFGASLALLGVTAGSAIGGAVLISAGTAAVLTRGFGPFTSYPHAAIVLALWMAFALAALSMSWQAWQQPLRNTARFAAAFSTAALYLQLLVLLHPNMPIGDAMFHAHRFQGVLAGNLYFTSIAPGGYAFPYPPGLYVFASAFARLVRRGAQDVVLLRIVTASVSAIAGLLLYPVTAAVWRNRLAAAMAVAIYHLMPITFAVLTTGNLTNAFAQSVAVMAFALMGTGRVRPRHARPMLLLTLLLSAAYLSHTSTIAILFVATIAIAGLFIWRRDQLLRSSGVGIAIASVIAAVIAVVLYYAHFGQTYRAEFARIGHETATRAADAGGRTISDRLTLVPYSLAMLFGWPLVALAIAGAVLRVRHAADSLSLSASGWIAACLLFLAIGVLTPVDMRYYLAAIPALAVFAGYAGAYPWTDAGREHRAAWCAVSALGLLALVTAGIRHWWAILG